MVHKGCFFFLTILYNVVKTSPSNKRTLDQKPSRCERESWDIWGTGWKAASAKALKWACAGHVWEQKEGQRAGQLLRGEC